MIFKADKHTVHIRNIQSNFKLTSHSQSFILKHIKITSNETCAQYRRMPKSFKCYISNFNVAPHWWPTRVKMINQSNFKHWTFALWRCRVGPITYPTPPPSHSYIWGSNVWNESHYCFDMCKIPSAAHTEIWQMIKRNVSFFMLYKFHCCTLLLRTNF
jgi:hypothetical protein